MNTHTFWAILERIRAAQVADVRVSWFRLFARRAVQSAIFVSNIRPLYLITGALLLPLVLSIPLKRLASWRPHRVSQMAFSAFRGGPYLPGESAKLSPDGRFLVSAGSDTTQDKVLVWNASNAQQRGLFALPARLVPGTTPFALSQSGDEIAFFWSAGAFAPRRASLWRTIGQIYSWKTGKFRALFAPSRTRWEDVPCDVRFSPDQTQIWLASSDAVLRFDARSARFLRRDSFRQTGDLKLFTRALFLSDAPLVVRDNWIGLSLWNVGGKPQVLGPQIVGNSPALSPDGKRLAISGTPRVGVADVATGAILWRGDEQADALLWSRDGHDLLALRGSTLDVLSPDDGQLRRRLALPCRCTRVFLTTSSSQVWLMGDKGDLISQRFR